MYQHIYVNWPKQKSRCLLYLIKKLEMKVPSNWDFEFSSRSDMRLESCLDLSYSGLYDVDVDYVQRSTLNSSMLGIPTSTKYPC